jgi:hypothetical protein
MALLALLLSVLIGSGGSGYHASLANSYQHVQPADSLGEGAGG